MFLFISGILPHILILSRDPVFLTLEFKIRTIAHQSLNVLSVAHAGQLLGNLLAGGAGKRFRSLKYTTRLVNTAAYQFKK